MLYKRWTRTARLHRNEPALRDAAAGRHWTFGELFEAGEREKTGPASAVFPSGHSPEFILQVLAGWREGRVLCPLEPGQAHPLLSGAPAHCVHFKRTSATTGGARLIAFTARQLAADADQIVRTMGLRSDWPNVGVISLAHSYGFSNLVLPLLLHGIPLVLAAGPLPEMVRRAAGSEGNVTIPAVPAIWRAWHEARAIPANTRLAISAGAPLSLKLEQEIFKAGGLKIHNFYGASECGGIAFDASDAPREDAAIAGMPLDGVQVSLNEDGCLIVQSDAVGETYWPPAPPSPGNRVFQTFDLAELKDGKVLLHGRLNDLINVAGRKVSPETIESVLLSHPAIRDCLVLGVPSRDKERGQTIAAIIASDAAAEELKAFALERMPAWQAPRLWHFVDSLESNARGKLSRAQWRKKFGGS
ncbi:MAG: acyl--CoA ligase [Verrucomicrobia bacterium]|nr:acyl--CoA ligase [Verrucomicrobiota bacterium]MDE3098383.1 acyl--CoA ligase [Verrucomicrobiota bacterium]